MRDLRILAFAAFLVVSARAQNDCDAPTVRVALERFSTPFEFALADDATIGDTTATFATFTKGERLTVRTAGSMIEIRTPRLRLMGASFRIAALDADAIAWRERRYRGCLEFSASGDDALLVNVLSIDAYVRGCLPPEMGYNESPDRFEALKAAAVAVRSFGLMKKRASADLPYDLERDVRDQVYEGYDVEKPLHNEATNETRGEILYHQGEPAIVFYHGSCGGATEAVERVFGGDPIPYLVSVDDGDPPNCAIKPNFEWSARFSEPTIRKRLGAGAPVVEILTTRAASGRVERMSFRLQNGEERTTEGQQEIRRLFRDEKGVLMSARFRVETERRDGRIATIVLRGTGSGHGVGLCQWGAIGLSQKGTTYRDILQRYFPGTEIHNLYDAD
jgi:stage II sporulation protein D